MKLHLDEENFSALITFASTHFGITEVLIEKDYWVTLGLYNLSNSEFKDHAVFKGGTSLSKAHGIINRFSEDIDLAVLIPEGMSSNQMNKLLRKVEAACIKDFKEVTDDPRIEPKGSYRKTVWEFKKIGLEKKYGDAGEHILIEVNSFTKPEPHEELPIQCLIAKYLLETSKHEFIQEFELQPFNMAVLKAERTFVEKISAISKHSHLSKDDNFSDLAKNIRHIYDLVKLFERCQATVLNDDAEMVALLKRVKEDDKNMDKRNAWSHFRYQDAPIFQDFENVWTRIATAYNGQFRNMLFGNEVLPTEGSVREMISAVYVALKKHE